ncbi:cytochrome P450 6B6-like [Aricia agestis]|uniref:cytochrome P450 6B6-like n=1 Tax=Aricia agestis TaxID=91739 RepID=UPI001C209536|nr:cytochrome P450 6B6-like [Aricia agestis]
MFPILIVLVFLTLYLYGKRNHDYWRLRGVKYEEPMVFFGGNLRPALDGMSYSERYAAIHKKYENEKYVGLFKGNSPALLVRDPELIKHVLSSDFKNFHFRGLNPNEEVIEPLFHNIFTIDGDTWKLTRQKMTPAFTSGKLKAMFPLILQGAAKLVKMLDEVATAGAEVDVRDLMARYTTDFIGAVGFGVDSNSLNDENSDFRKLGKRISMFTKRDTLVAVLKMSLPNIFKNLRFIAPEVERKTTSIVRQILAQRNFQPSNRNDFVDFMLELKQKGTIVGESIDKVNADGSPAMVELEVDERLITAQIFLFFLAGFETSSSASSFLLHNLAYHPECQARCQREIDDVLEKYDGKLSFDAVKEMKFTEMCLKEALRILPSPGFLHRKCTRPYTLPGTDLTIDKDVAIVISAQGLHHDERYFDEPEQFRPDRFDPERGDKIPKYAYMPFGEGPRSCIGERMGIMQSLAGVATVLRHFTVVPAESSVRTPRIDPRSGITQNILGGLPLAIRKR